ncbi:uncharacterized protein LOC124293242 isoform X2 [Neodiprion lecontei]|uniref:Uncharacterized protein LOC124293242 isoform X2 n=1 Tax=Neodiprion lecontei TaxID=441921 RepID=A0ABM3FMQ1_NEOLC|nr:uncharacterized protein LOC124214977 isoform X2 [Neodiprion pinetum]XP_046589297.1 uncharacterized protein LOC124293242 isoform X2 [Neodiprion lecontei]
MESVVDDSGVRFSPRETKSKAFCSVYGCKSKACRDSDVRFHLFPKKNNFIKIINTFGEEEKVDCRKMWQIVLKIGKNVTDNMQVCSLHFKQSDYFSPDKTPRLITNKNTDRETRRLRRDKSRNEVLPASQLSCQDQDVLDTNNLDTNNLTEEPDDQGESSSISLVQDTPLLTENDQILATKRLVDIGVQIKSGDLITDFCDILKTEKELNTLTGIINFDILKTIIDVVKDGFPKYRFETMNLRSKIIMTFIKLKHNLSYAILAVLFKYSSLSQCRRVVLKIIDMLYVCLKEGIPFPDKDEISKNLPVCFDDFRNVRIVLDCTEIFIQRPKNLCCQQASYSRYKSTYTIKFMTGVTPGGIISFISEMYGGRVSDDAIFEQSKILNYLEKGEAIMVDKGFRVDKLCKEKDIKLIRPPFKKEQLQFTREESRLNAKIARARVHVERSNQRLKVFKVLGSRMPIGLVKKGKEILTIIGAVVNLSSPILKDDKFLSEKE